MNKYFKVLLGLGFLGLTIVLVYIEKLKEIRKKKTIELEPGFIELKKYIETNKRYSWINAISIKVIRKKIESPWPSGPGDSITYNIP